MTQTNSVPPRPSTLWIALGALSLEALALVGAGVWAVALAVSAQEEVTSLLALGAMFVVFGALMVGVMFGVSRGVRWARPASVAWQVLQLISGFAIVGQDFRVGGPAIVLAVATLVGLFAPPTLTWYEARLLEHEAREEERLKGLQQESLKKRR
ncbi:hypothetical protein [Brevibacterium mcbrellneri]|uniref:hypothetical protein n=1 Tax=Brevibacterium mcbrellneri TaxID=53363 RepID=UPI00031B53CE|nr:hypothetical protein [Brevibacterium mcbrellneri]